ncbi:hypothetical protein C1N61_05945 [Priestia aryabhattai]
MYPPFSILKLNCVKCIYEYFIRFLCHGQEKSFLTIIISLSKRNKTLMFLSCFHKDVHTYHLYVIIEKRDQL